MNTDTLITALAPTPEPFDPAWSQQTLAEIRSADQSPQRPHRVRRTVLVGAAAGVLTLGTATAFAGGGPESVVKDLLDGFIAQPNTTGNGLGELNDPQLVAKFRMQDDKIFAIWVATPTATQGVCSAMTDGSWDGTGTPDKSELEYGCGGDIWTGPDTPPAELTRPEQLGGFFKDFDGPLVYGVSPYADAVAVRVQGIGVDRTLPVRADSHGYGSALPEAAQAPAVTLTFVDASGQVLGTKRVVAPIG